MKNDVSQADIDYLMSLSEEELQEIFKKIDWSDIDPTIEEIEDELENEVERRKKKPLQRQHLYLYVFNR